MQGGAPSPPPIKIGICSVYNLVKQKGLQGKLCYSTDDSDGRCNKNQKKRHFVIKLLENILL